MTTKETVNEKQHTVLLLGDWVVDDNWVIGAHQSSISTNTGRHHYRSLNHPANSIQRFCGAGRIAALLHAANQQPISLMIHGLGLWHPDDTPHFYQLFRPETAMCHTPYLLHIPKPPDSAPPRISLTNLAPVVQAAGYQSVEMGKSHDAPLDKHFGTTRIIRHFQQDRGNLRQLSRVDWELAPRREEGHSAWLTVPDLKDPKVQNELNRAMNGIHSVDAVIIKDLGKGVVSTAFLRALLDSEHLQLSEKPWYISTKVWDPPWIKLLHDRHVPVKLIHFPHVAFRQNADVPTWVTSEGLPTAEAFDSLYRIGNSFFSATNNDIITALVGPKLRAMLMELVPQCESVVSRENRERNLTLFVHPKENPNEIDFNNTVGNASAFFAALTFGLLHRNLASSIGAKIEIETGVLFQKALDASQFWIDQECMWLKSPERISKPSELVFDMQADKTKPTSFSLETKRSQEWDSPKIDPIELPDPYVEEDWEDWIDAMKGLGIITKKKRDSYSIQLWRACVEFPDYVCCVPAKRKALAKLRDQIYEFRPNSKARSISGLLVSKPGSGKSHFVKRLASELHLKTLSYNITTLCHRDDLLACFDQIVTTQSELGPDEKLLVFVDEINALLQGHSVYDAFLAPLEDGYYIRRSFKFHIKPCIWLFAGTIDGDAIKKDTKGSDFVSRLTMGQIDLTLGPGEYPELQKTERVYLGLALARSVYTDLRSVRKRVMQVLSNLKPGLSTRDIRRFVEKNLTVSRGQGDWKKPKTVYTDNEDCFGFSTDEREKLQEQLRNEGEQSIGVEYA